MKNRSRDFYSFDNNIGIKRYNLQNNVNAYLSESTKLSLRLNANLVDREGPGGSVESYYSGIMQINPVDFPVMHPDDESLQNIRSDGTSSQSISLYNQITR